MVIHPWVHNHYGSGFVLHNSKVNVTFLLWRFQDWESEKHYVCKSIAESKELLFPKQDYSRSWYTKLYEATTATKFSLELKCNYILRTSAKYKQKRPNTWLFFFFLLCFCSVFAGRINYPKHTIILNWNTQIRQFSESFRSFFQKLIVALKDWSFLMSINNYKDPKKIN